MKKYYVFKIVEGILGEKPIIDFVKNLNANEFELNETILKVGREIFPLFPYKKDENFIERVTTLGDHKVRLLSPGIFAKRDKDWFVIASVDPTGFAVFFHDIVTQVSQIEYQASKKPKLESLLPTLVQLYSLRNYDKTIESATMILKIHPEPNFAYFLRGMSFLLVKNYQQAIEDLKAFEKSSCASAGETLLFFDCLVCDYINSIGLDID